MKINRDNYEAFFLDYLEGNLAPDVLPELETFLKMNPDLKAELDEIGSMESLASETIDFPDKEMLLQPEFDLKEIAPGNFAFFCVAYFEGDLGADQKNMLQAYLKQNPEQKTVFDTFGKARHFLGNTKQEEIFDDKASLYVPDFSFGAIDHTTFSDFFVAYYEGDLNERQKAAMFRFLEMNPSYRSEFDSFAKAKVSPDLTVVFEGKSQLKKTVVVPFRRKAVYWSVAASVAVLFGMFLFMNRDNSQSGNELASNDTLQHRAIKRHSLRPADTMQPVIVPENRVPVSDKKAKRGGNVVPASDMNVFQREKTEMQYANSIRAERIDEPAAERNIEIKETFDDYLVQQLPDPGLTPEVLQGADNYIYHKAAGLITGEKQTASVAKPGFWNWASFGVKAYNQIFGKKESLVKQKRGTEEVIGLASGKFEFSKKSRK